MNLTRPNSLLKWGDRKVHLAGACEGEVGVRWPDSASWDLPFGTLSAVSSSTAVLHFFAGGRGPTLPPNRGFEVHFGPRSPNLGGPRTAGRACNVRSVAGSSGDR